MNLTNSTMTSHNSHKVRLFSSGGISVSEGKQHFQGILEKYHGRFVTSWKRYWFVLHGDQLSYFKDEKISSGLRQGLIDLTMAKTVNACVSPNRGFPFEVVTSTRKYILSASAEEVRTQWIEYIGHAVVKRRHSEFSASMSRPNCQSIEEDEHMTHSLDELLTKKSMGSSTDQKENSGKDVPVIKLEDPIVKDSEAVYIKVDSSAILRRKNLQRQQYQDHSNISENYDIKNTASSPVYSVIWPNQITSTDSVKDENDNDAGKCILRRKTQLSRLCPAVSSEVASQFIYSSVASTNDADDVFSGQLARNTAESSWSTSSQQSVNLEDYLNSDFSPIPELPHPRLEMTFTTTPFDQIRIFIAHNRGPNELYPSPDVDELGGKAVHKLKEFMKLIA